MAYQEPKITKDDEIFDLNIKNEFCLNVIEDQDQHIEALREALTLIANPALPRENWGSGDDVAIAKKALAWVPTHTIKQDG